MNDTPHPTIVDDTPHLAPVLLTIPQAATALQVGRCTMQELVLTGEVRSLKIGRLRRIPAVALDEYVAGRLAIAVAV
ncbi:MAG: helix-turn-helix protein [Acidimicrobiales bacterium]|nr:helix-turn-helix protein [Acidimicrobiales bacterium]